MASSPRNIRERLLGIAEPVCAGGGYELVDLRFVNEAGGWVVRVFIDHSESTARSGAPAIGFDDCEQVSRELSAVFDVEDPVPHAYRLEVSSPGVDRPLRTADHFRRFSGERAKVSLASGVDGRRNFTGVLAGVDGDGADTTIRIDVDGRICELPFGDISSAKLIPDWDRLMAESQ